MVDVARAGDLAPDSALKIEVQGQDIALVRCVEGIFAIGNRCSHADVELSEGEVDGCALECWLHGSQFDLRTGQPLSLPALLVVGLLHFMFVWNDFLGPLVFLTPVSYTHLTLPTKA